MARSRAARKARHGLRLNGHLEHPDGLTVFQHACRMGVKGIVSKRLGSRYRSGRFARLAEIQESGKGPNSVQRKSANWRAKSLALARPYSRAVASLLSAGTRTVILKVSCGLPMFARTVTARFSGPSPATERIH
jgi:hypothetical protein